MKGAAIDFHSVAPRSFMLGGLMAPNDVVSMYTVKRDTGIDWDALKSRREALKAANVQDAKKKQSKNARDAFIADYDAREGFYVSKRAGKWDNNDPLR